jgi:hypothetical protein
MFPSSQAILLDAKKRDPTLPDPSIQRFGEPAKFLPVCFIFSIIITLYITYVTFHCLPLLQDPDTFAYGMNCLVVFNVLTLLVFLCYFRSMFEHPGTIPDNASTEDGGFVWEKRQRSRHTGSQDQSYTGKESKRLGGDRSCKWCNKYKPDRCHHCRVCRMCVLKMDHHCPWIYNCVGFKNFKYFFLLVLYSTLVCHMIVWTMMIDVINCALEPQNYSFMTVFGTLFGESLAGLMGFLLTGFLAFHVHLMIKNMTTIEFCEKSRRPNFDTDIYNLGILDNVKSVLGDNPLLWLFPVSPPSGDGMSFEGKQAFLAPVTGEFQQIQTDGAVSNYGSTVSADAQPQVITVTFAPGRLGITAAWASGLVREVVAGSQGDRADIRAGMTFEKIDGVPYTERILDQRISGTADFIVTFLPPARVTATAGTGEAPVYL